MSDEQMSKYPALPIKHFRRRKGSSVREISNAISSLGRGCKVRIRYFNNSCTFEDGEGGLWKMY